MIELESEFVERTIVHQLNDMNLSIHQSLKFWTFLKFDNKDFMRIRKDQVLEQVKSDFSHLRPLSARRNSKFTKRDKDNPFNIPDVTDVFAEQDKIVQERQEKIKGAQKLTLKQRQMLPSQVTSQRSIRERIEQKFRSPEKNKDTDIKGVTEIRQRQQHTTQLLQEQREIFLANLLIDCHQRELDRINITKQTRKAKFDELQLTLEEDQNRLKTVRRQLEMTRDREKLMLEEQMRKRTEIEVKVKRKRQNVDVLKVELNQLEEKKANYLLYGKLLDQMEETYGTRPSTISEFIDAFDRLEHVNLFLIQNSRQQASKYENSQYEVEIELEETKKDINDLEQQIEKLKEQKNSIQLLNESNHDTVDLDDKLEQLQNSISKTFVKCFPAAGNNQNSLTMLSMIENEIETMIKRLDLINDKEMIAQKVKQLNNQRRTEYRLENQARNEKIQLEKKLAMQERATKPVKKRNGRPLVERIVIGQTKKKNTAKLEAEQYEKERLDNLLFGDTIYD